MIEVADRLTSRNKDRNQPQGAVTLMMLRDKINRSNTILYCRNWEPTVAFYRDVLKLPVNHDAGWFIEFRLADDSYLSIADIKRATVEATGGQGITLSLRVRGLDNVRRQMQSAGIRVSTIKHLWSARTFFLRDPEGHRIEIWAGSAAGRK